MRIPLALARFFAALALLTPLLARPADAPPHEGQRRGTFLLVHGGWGGSWAWRPVEIGLRRAGYDVYRPALVGTAETAHLASPGIGLETHIQQIVNLILYEDLRDVLLTGYSYSGMVVAGVADRIPDRIRRVIFIDAFLPVDGESTFSFIDGMRSPMAQQMRSEIQSSAGAGLVPAFWEKADAVPPKQDPQPYRTLVDRIALGNPRAQSVPGTFLQFVPQGTKPEEADFASSAARARARNWPVIIIPGDHGTPFRSPEVVTGELIRVADQASAESTRQ